MRRLKSLPPIPVSPRLVPDARPAVPEGFTAVQASIVNGLPHTMPLGDTEAVLVVPNGLAATWRDADPTLVVTSSEGETAAVAPAAPLSPVVDVGRASPRLLVRRNGVLLGAMPLVAGFRRAVADAGDAERGARIEIVVVEWDIRAGSLRGSGDFGSRLTLGWRRADEPVAQFSIPPPPLDLVRQLPVIHRVESQLGLVKAELFRFDRRRLPLKSVRR